MNTNTRYRKKPVEISALQWNGGNYDDIKAFAGDALLMWHINHDSLSIDTLEGAMKAFKNDYIIRSIKGEFYPCKPDIFEATYEQA